MPIALTGRQRMALDLERDSFSHEVIAQLMGLKNRESATRLLGRARRALRAIGRTKENLAELLA